MSAVFRLGDKLRQSLMRVKTTVDEDMKKGVVYEVPCGECEGEDEKTLICCEREGYEE